MLRNIARLSLCTLVTLSALLGCADGDSSAARGEPDAAGEGRGDARDGATLPSGWDQGSDAATQRDAGASGDARTPPGEGVCEGDRWSSEPGAPVELAKCITITGNLTITSGYTTLELPRLESVGGFMTLWGNQSLVRASFPSLRSIGGFLEVDFNDVLTDIRLPVLENVNSSRMERNFDVVIKGNIVLPGCRAEAVRDQLLSHGYTGSISVGGVAGTCSP